MNDLPLVQITTTLESREDAEKIATTLVEEGLAACVQIDGPIRSVYRWKGTVETTGEYRLTIKTAASRVEAVTRRVAELHPYELPEIVFLPLGATVNYATWVRDNTDLENDHA